ncbi:MAG: lactonase family protein [Pirellulales bacterium]
MKSRFAMLQGLFIFLLGVEIPFMTTQSTAGEKEATSGSLWVYIAGDGIHQYLFDLDTGVMTPRSVTHDAQPSFLAIHPNGRSLYGAGKELSAFSIDQASGALTLLNQIPYQKHGLCHLVVDATGGSVLSAGYGAGTVSVHQIGEDRKLGEHTALAQHEGSSLIVSRQQGPHAHSINLDPDNQFAFAADLGIDKIMVYRFNAAQGSLDSTESSVALAPGAGPRHFTFHPQGRFAYVINELNSTVVAYRYDGASGQLTEIETITTLPADFVGKNYPAEVVVDPSGRFLYGSNRGHDSIVVYAIDPDRGTLTWVQHVDTGGKWPRNFCIDPTGQYLLAANQQSDNVVVFRVEPSTGELTANEHVIKVPSPSCIRFLQPQ